MADRPQLNCSVLIDDYFACSETLLGQNALIASTPSKKVNLINKGNEFAWNGCLESLKNFVHADLNLRSKWSSPGGEVKLFKDPKFSFKWYVKNKKLVIVQDDEKQCLTNKLKTLATIAYRYDNGGQQGKEEVDELMANTVISENLSTGKPEHTTFERNNEQSSAIQSITTDSSCKAELDSACYCSELAVQVKRIECDIKLLKGQMGINTLCCNFNTCQKEKNRLKQDLEQANMLVKDLQARINILQNEKSSNVENHANAHEGFEIDANDPNAHNNLTGISEVEHTIDSSNKLQCVESNIVVESIAETQQATYAQAAKSHPKSYTSKSNEQRSDKPESSSSLIQLPQRNVDPDGFTGVNRKRKRTKKYFLSGIHESVNEGQIRSYLEQKKVTPTYISLFRSRRKGTCSAKVHIPSSMCPLVQADDFWPKYVKCSLWQTKTLFEGKTNITRDGKYSTRV